MRPHLHSRAIAVVVGAIVAASLSVSAQTTPLRMVSTAWPPFTNLSGHPRFALDLVEAALSRTGVTTTTTIVEPARFTAALLSGDFDGSAAVWKDAERARVLFFSQPYLENRLVLIGRKGADVSATNLSALTGKKIAIVDGYSYGDIEKAGPVFVRSQSEEDSLARMLSSKVDYVLMDELVVQFIVNNYPKEAQAKLQLGTTPLVTRELYLAIKRSHPQGESIILRFNAQLRGMIADHTYHRLLHVPWIEADVNGDGLQEYVPQTDRPGPVPPDRAYSLFAPPAPPSGITVPEMNKPGFYVGGTIYPDWASVPNMYKVAEPNKPPDSSRNTASIFKFVW